MKGKTYQSLTRKQREFLAEILSKNLTKDKSKFSLFLYYKGDEKNIDHCTLAFVTEANAREAILRYLSITGVRGEIRKCLLVLDKLRQRK